MSNNLQMEMNRKLNFAPPLDPGFQPAVVFNRNYGAAAKRTSQTAPLVIGREREWGVMTFKNSLVNLQR